MGTDLGHLHDVILNKPYGRQFGKTHARCEIIAGYVDLKMPKILAIVSYYHDCGYISRMLIPILKEHGVDAEWSPHHILNTDFTEIKFVTEANAERALRGYDGVIVHIRHED